MQARGGDGKPATQAAVLASAWPPRHETGHFCMVRCGMRRRERALDAIGERLRL